VCDKKQFLGHDRNRLAKGAVLDAGEKKNNAPKNVAQKSRKGNETEDVGASKPRKCCESSRQKVLIL